MKKSTKKLPKLWRGATVVRGEGMNADKLSTFLESLRCQSLTDQCDLLEEILGSWEPRARIHALRRRTDNSLVQFNVDH